MKAEGGAVAAARARRRNTASISFDCIQIFINIDGSIWRAAIERSLSLGRSVQHGNPRWRERGTEAGGTSEEQMAWKAKKKKTKKKTTGKLEKTSGKPGINPGRKIREYLDTHKHTHTQGHVTRIHRRNRNTGKTERCGLIRIRHGQTVQGDSQGRDISQPTREPACHTLV